LHFAIHTKLTGQYLIHITLLSNLSLIQITLIHHQRSTHHGLIHICFIVTEIPYFASHYYLLHNNLTDNDSHNIPMLHTRA